MFARVAKKLALPVFGLALVFALAFQVRGAARNETLPTPAPPASEVIDRVAADGRVVTYPGGQVAVAADVPGTVLRLEVAELDRVERGQLIAELRADDLEAELAEARARVSEGEAELKMAELDLERATRLFAAEVGTREALDRAQTRRDAVFARGENAHAAVRRLEAQRAKARVFAPISGVVLVRNVQPGEHVEAGEALVTVADLTRVRIEAEVDEFDAGRVRLGAPVRIEAEGYGATSWKGTVEEIPDVVVGRRQKPLDPGKPSDTRVLLVKIAFDEATPLKLGQRVEVRIGEG
ncbi:MAG: efflux RND transporter periplasmic adaptor subunit [Thermoanaerobaculia bacterium]|nr:efflux RND transporter periplasmic adaptor subunit [Thermoanaerobaculia bacterium]